MASITVELPTLVPLRRLAIAVTMAVWGCAAVAGVLSGFWYEITPTPTHDACKLWPAESALSLSEDRPTLLMFVHPRCPCSRASLEELSKLMARCNGHIDAQVLFFAPASSSVNWTNTDLWEQASRIPGIQTRVDVDGVERCRFGARVSGEVVLYRPHGELVFHGGITSGRGHVGDNAGRSSLESLLTDHTLRAAATPVFGCGLETPRDAML